ncbi:MAG: methyltransferase domain-containing protein [Verrucomicrobia bacterium]|nr:MAG: methyltransferase domain-containing protein [Verrucomicrobiota bacterium]TAE85490.1 MAG: methyltransferase domain-containing protein [Verrucomicrobiota bacterium]TAF22595.1 MAG: methyltransferase domain-containing protein [Verrucomicrobiota bacterium]
MNDPVRQLYSEQRYPALSHPVTDISRLAVSARLAGMSRLAPPSACRVLEFGCASGHNLLPLAARYPDSDFTGLDYSESAIREARRAAWESGLENIRFEVADLQHWRPSHPCDYLIAHGVFSWVPDPVKSRVMDLCGQVLADSGVACISYNTLPGWSLRRDVVPLLRALAGNPLASGLGRSVPAVAESLATMTGAGSAHSAHLQAICRDMIRKGPEVLPFDDFAPVCDPVYFAQFADWASQRGLRYLGEARLRDELPEGIDPASWEQLAPLAADPVLLQQTLDLLSGRTHRVSLLCRQDTPLEETTTAVLLDFAAGRGEGILPPGDDLPLIRTFCEVLDEADGDYLEVRELMESTAARLGAGWESIRHARELALWIFKAARLGGIELRTEPVKALPEPIARPCLSRLNRHFAANEQPVVDARHASCRFPQGHARLLAAMDGSLSVAELAARADEEFPELDFDRWLAYLAKRGLLVADD